MCRQPLAYVALAFIGVRLCFCMQQGIQVQERVDLRWKEAQKNHTKLWTFEKGKEKQACSAG